MWVRYAVLTLAFLLLPGLVSAQDSPDPGRAILDTQDALTILNREAECITDRRQELEDTLRLLREALVQHNRARAGSAERQAARETVRSLVQRRRAILQRVSSCHQQLPVDNRPPQGEVVRNPAPDPAADHVATRGDAAREIERDVQLVTNVHAVVGQRVDGRGELSADQARRAIRSAAPSIARCYDRANGHGALRRGRAIVSFTVTPSGRISRARVEQNTLGSRFGTCVQAAVRRIRTSGSQNGDVTIAYTLSFPE